jgi:hypothetical protein
MSILNLDKHHRIQLETVQERFKFGFFPLKFTQSSTYKLFNITFTVGTIYRSGLLITGALE